MKDRYLEIPLEELVTPKDGYVVLMDKWWRVTKEGKALIYILNGCFTPQCNSNKDIATRLSTDDGEITAFMPLAYIPSEYY